MPRKKKTRKPANQSSRKQPSSKRKPPKGKKTPRHDSAESPMPPRFMMEQAMADMFGRGRGGAEAEAQDLAYDAMEAVEQGDVQRAVQLASLAADIDPRCIDAGMLLAQFASETKDELLDYVERIVTGAELDWGTRFFKEHRGHFWGLLETRPYMRARAQLAELLIEAGRRDEAIEHYEALLDLNPGDNQGLRYGLLGLYLETDRLEQASALFEQYEGEWSAMFKWSRVLERFLNGDPDGAREALAEARETNPHVEPLLVGRKPVPRNRPDYYSPGDEREAAICMNEIGSAWQRRPESIAWLKAQE